MRAAGTIIKTVRTTSKAADTINRVVSSIIREEAQTWAATAGSDQRVGFRCPAQKAAPAVTPGSLVF